MSPAQICQHLIDRIIQASIYTHQPPPFVVKDWRFAEFPPAAQALTGAGIELMAGPNYPPAIIQAFLSLCMRRPIQRPYDTINAIGNKIFIKKFSLKIFSVVANNIALVIPTDFLGRSWADDWMG